MLASVQTIGAAPCHGKSPMIEADCLVDSHQTQLHVLQPLQLAAVPVTLVKLVLIVAGSLDPLSPCGRGQMQHGHATQG